MFKRPLKYTILLGGFLAVTIGSVVAAVLPPAKAASIVTPYACPAGTRAAIDKQDQQCNEHNRTSGTCQTMQIDCVRPDGSLAERLHPNTSLLYLWGLCVLYCFAVIGPLIFIGIFLLQVLFARILKAARDKL